MDEIFTYLRALLRRIWIILAVFLLGSVLAVAVAYVLPPVYESTAKILVESQQIPEELAQTTVRASVAERLQLIEQRLMTRDNLLDLVNRLNLFADRRDMTPTEKVDLVRSNTTFENLAFEGAGRGGAQVSAFTISYRTNSAGLAARVASEFVTMVLEQNLASRSARASETYEFFSQQVERLAGELLDLEAQIALYKNENDDALPASYEFRLSELATLEQRQFGLKQRRVQLVEQRRALESGGTFAGATASVSPEQRELAELRRLLIRKRSMLADSHPEIVSLQANIGALEAAIAPEDLSEVPDSGEMEQAEDTFLANRTRAEMGVIDRELALIDEQLEDGEMRVQELRESLARTPNVEMALNAFQRRYQGLQAQYDNAVRKLAEADTGQRLEVNRQAERFEVIEQAQVPGEPVAPPRMLIAGGGAVASLALGIALALALETMRPVIRTATDLQRRLDLRPMVTVPYIKTRYERRRRALHWLARIVLVTVAVAAVLWLAHRYVLPLEVLWSRVMDKLGIEGIIDMVRARLG